MRDWLEHPEEELRKLREKPERREAVSEEAAAIADYDPFRRI